MKKTFLSLGLLATLALSANAQDVATGSEFKPTAGNITVELNASSPFASANPFSLGNTYFGSPGVIPSLRFRYFLSDGLAVRLNFAIVANKYKQDLGSTTTGSFTGTPPVSGSGTDVPTTFKVTSSNTFINIAPGLEIHKDISERLSVYYGAFIDFGIQSAKGKVEGTPGSTSVSGITGAGAGSVSIANSGSYTYELSGANFGNPNNLTGGAQNWDVSAAGDITRPTFSTTGGGTSTVATLRNNGTRGFTRIGLVGIIGADYYITKALYLGVEVGWGFATTSYKKVKVKESATQISTTTTTNGLPAVPTPQFANTASEQVEENKDSQLQFSPVVNAAFRFGFWF